MTRLLPAALCVLLLAGCGGAGNAPANAPRAALDVSHDLPPTEAGAKAALEEFAKPQAEMLKLLAQLKPSRTELEVIYQPAYVEKALAAEEKLWFSTLKQGGLRFEKDQTQVLLHRATTRELAAWGAETARDFSDSHAPERFKRVALYVNDGLTFYRFRFVKPGLAYGAVFDALLTHANGRWVLIQNPVRVIERYDEIMAYK